MPFRRPLQRSRQFAVAKSAAATRRHPTAKQQDIDVEAVAILKIKTNFRHDTFGIKPRRIVPKGVWRERPGSKYGHIGASLSSALGAKFMGIRCEIQYNFTLVGAIGSLADILLRA